MSKDYYTILGNAIEAALTTNDFKIGVATEQERITKLLEDALQSVSGGIFDAKGVLANVLAQVKGETE